MVIEGLVAVLALVGAFLNARRKRSGFYLWFAANLLGSAFFVFSHLYVMSGLYLVFAALNIYGLAQWDQEKS